MSAGTAKTQIQYLSALNLLLYFDILLCKLTYFVTIKTLIKVLISLIKCCFRFADALYRESPVKACFCSFKNLKIDDDVSLIKLNNVFHGHNNK